MPIAAIQTYHMMYNSVHIFLSSLAQVYIFLQKFGQLYGSSTLGAFKYFVNWFTIFRNMMDFGRANLAEQFLLAQIWGKNSRDISAKMVGAI